MKILTSTPYIRRMTYAILSVALLVAVGFGWITLEQADQWQVTVQSALDTLIPILAAGALGVAARKTHEGSDDSATEADVVAAREQGRREALDDARSIVNEVTGRAGGALATALAPYVGPTSRA